MGYWTTFIRNLQNRESSTKQSLKEAEAKIFTFAPNQKNMKAILILLTAAFALSCNNSSDTSDSTKDSVYQDSVKYQERLVAEKDSTNFSSIQWIDSISQNMGKMKEGAVLDISWRFRNVGDKPLVIIQADAGCGCTVAEKPEQPIAPGGEGVIKAKFDSNGRPGQQNKNVTVRANTKENPYNLTFSVVVESKK